MALHRIVVLGDGGVGKTETYDPTIEDSYRKQVVIDDSPCILEILDTAGQEEYTALRDQWIRDGEGFVLVYSITSKSTFERVDRFKDQILRVKDTSSAPMVLVGNKCDRNQDREVSKEQGAQLAKSLSCEFVEASAKNAINVEKTLGINVDHSKQLLQDLLDSNPDLHAVYYSKKLIDSKIVVSISRQKTGHVFAVAPFPISMDGILLMDHQISKSDTLDSGKLRGIQNSSILQVKTEEKEKRIDLQVPTTSTNLKPKDSSFFGSKVSAKKQKSKPVLEGEKSKSALEVEKSKRVLDGEVVIRKKTKKSTIDQAPIPSDENTKKSIETKNTEPKPRPQQQEQEIKPTISKESQDKSAQIQKLFEDDQPVQEKKELTLETLEAPSVQRVRKKRKIRKTITTMEGKYMKTQDVTDWESYSEEEVVKAVKKQPKPTNVTTKKTGKDASGKNSKLQKTISSFFKK